MAMNTLSSAAHLQREIGEELFAVLVSSDNTAAVKAFAEGLVKAGLPTTMTIAGRTYDILGFLREGEDSVKGDMMVNRAKEMQAHLGQDDGQHLLAHQDEIPAVLRGKVVFVCTDWQRSGDPEGIACLCWDGGRWVQYWTWLVNDWLGGYRVLRRKSA